MEKLEAKGPWSGTESDSVDPKGEIGCRSTRTKAARKERETLKEAEMELHGMERRHKVRVLNSKVHSDSRRIRRDARLCMWGTGNRPERSTGNSLRAECPQRTTRTHLLVRQSMLRKTRQILADCIGGS